MCQTIEEGGKRCPSGTKKRLDAVAEKIQKAVEANDMLALVEAKDQWSKAAAEYASTREGSDALAKLRQEATERNDVHTELLLQKALADGREIVKANEEIAALIRTARAASGLTASEREEQARRDAEEAARQRAQAERAAQIAEAQARSRDIADRFEETLGNSDLSEKELLASYKDFARDYDNANLYLTGEARKECHKLRSRIAMSVLSHPSAGEETFYHVGGSSHGGLAEALALPNAPNKMIYEELERLRSAGDWFREATDQNRVQRQEWYDQELNRSSGAIAVWRARATTDPDLNAALAFSDPDMDKRRVALASLAGTPARALSADAQSRVMRELVKAGGREVALDEHKKIMDGLLHLAEHEPDPARRMQTAAWLADYGHSWSLRRSAKRLSEPLVDA